WLGTKAGKIYVYNQNKEKIATLPDDLHPSKRFPLANIYTLYFDTDNNLWIGTKGYGIFVIKSPLKHIDNLGSKDLKTVHFKHDVEDANSISSDNVYSIKQDVYGQFWIGAFLSGIDLLKNPFSNPTFQTFSGVNGNTDGLPSDEIRDLVFDRHNNLWIATSNGVSVLESQYLNTEKKKFIHTTANTNNSSIPEEVVYQIKQVSNGDMLFAMLDGGVHRLAYSDYLEQNYTWKQCSGELAFSSIYSIEQDSEGNIWMGADNGLFRYNSDYEMIDRFLLKNNHLPLSFSENCSCTKLNQEIMFGSTNGLIVLHPDSMCRDPNQYPLLFSKLEVNGSTVSSQNSDILDVPIAWQNEIALSYNQNNITLFFSVLDFENPNSIQYKSFLEGYDNYWSAPSSNNSVSYRKLPPGKYTLWVKGTNSSGVWIDQTAKIEIVVTPLFRNSLLGRILLYLLTVIMISVILIVIYRQVSIQNKVRLENAITEKRIEYYTNLSHEFKTPLSLILGPVEEIISSQKSSIFAQQKGLQIKKNAIYIKRLIDQILDFRKIREGKMKLRVSEVNIIEFFREIYLVFLPLSKKMGIQFDFEYDESKYIGFADTSHIEKIAYNLLSNAFRFSSEGKRVRLMVSIDPTKKELHFSVVDQGPGISQEEIGKIFQRFYDSKHSSGIGLFYTQELVSLHKGEIAVKNNSDEGAHFHVSIPLSKKTYDENEMTNKKVGLAFDLRDISDIETIVSQDDMPEIEHKHLVDYFETILVVEDNVEMRNYLRNSLSDKHKVLVAKDGQEGLDIAQSKQPTLILSDVAMPVMDGYEMVRRLKSNFDTSHIPVFLVTAESSEEQKMFAMECGVDDFISKPFSLSFLLARVEHVITQRKRLKERFERDNEPNNETVVDTNVKKSNFLTHVQELVIDNMSNEQMNVEFLVEKMGYSRTLFYKKMRSFSGYAPNEYIRIVRMKEPARLLTTSDRTINEISSLVGISDSNYFSKMFKKHFGESPSAYKYNN
ncbi:MAG: response regulator, partial [Bacteroidales bacterium]|nr:response regulator [Bacteroidales bacterium]